MKRIHGISTIALAAALLLTPMLSAGACMMPSPDDTSARLDLPVPGVPVPGSPVRDGEATAEKYVILAPTHPGEPPRVVRWNGLDVAPAPKILVVHEQPVVLHAKPILRSALDFDPAFIQEAQLELGR